MGVLRETAAQWMRMLTITADRSLSMSEQARLISEVNGPVRLDVTLRPYRWPWQRAVAPLTELTAMFPQFTAGFGRWR